MVEKEKERLFIVRKYIKAKSVKEALDKEAKTPVHDCFVDEEWHRNNTAEPPRPIGFQCPERSTEEMD